MAEKLKIISLGGLNEIGKNITVLEYGGDMIVVDCGLGFPEDDMYGVDLVVPDVTYLIKNQQKLRGFFLTHGHEDHIGGLPYVLEQVNAPVHTTRLTAGLVQIKLEEHGLLESWLFSARPIWRMPKPSRIRPMARIRLNIKSERLLTTASGSVSANTEVQSTVIIMTVAARTR